VGAETKPTLGTAIDQLVVILEPLDAEIRAVAINTVCTFLKISLTERSATTTAHPAPVSAPPALTSTIAQHSTGASNASPAPVKCDIRTLKEEKRPRSAKEMACVVAFYLQEFAPENERKETIATEDLERYFKQANFKLPKVIGQVLKDAKTSGYFDTPTRGAYKLNAVGYNLVAHNLPPAGATP
jgi:hypothetical protein